jgi:hypothetical protein
MLRANQIKGGQRRVAQQRVLRIHARILPAQLFTLAQ